MNEGRQPYSDAGQRASSRPGDGQNRLRRPLIATAMLIALLSLFLWAGFWQLDRADQKRTILERYAAASGGDFVSEIVPDEVAEALRFRNVRLTGRYRSNRQFLLDNMTDGGSSGYQVLTPFVTAGGTVLVNRGWVSADADRNVLPRIAIEENERTIIGRLNNFPAPGLRLAAPTDAETGWPRRLLFPTAAELGAALDVELPAYQLQLDADQPDGYLRAWQAVDSGPEKHLGYAFQWFSFAVLACIFYVLLIRKDLWTNKPGDD